VPPIPETDDSKPDQASVQLSHYRTRLSNHRTTLSEHRTALSEYRTDLSTERTEMSMRRTGMSFQRTRLSADRTLMSVIRTSLSLISFGFTIFQLFQRLREQGVFTSAAPARNFGTSLVALGILMLVIGILYHVQFMLGLREVRGDMTADGLIHGKSAFPVSYTLITAVLLLLLGVFAIVSMVFHVGPFG
jgi:uncharacterized membrane protein YidH (DUF202 family)